MTLKNLLHDLRLNVMIKRQAIFCEVLHHQMGFPGVAVGKNPLPVKEMQVRSLGLKHPLGEEMATHSSVLAWKSPWIEEPGGLQSVGSQSQT